MLLFGLLLNLVAAQCYSGRQVTYNGAKLTGFTGVDGITAFLKVAYAEPPIGQFRFKQTVPLQKKLSGKISLDTLPPKCMQINTLPQDQTSEDCLYLNIYVPNTGTKLPVLVYIHGGSFTSGGANDYDGSELAKELNVIVVTVNYRLGVFGFMASTDLQDEYTSTKKSSLNAGLWDQREAFLWVKKNISKFGGNPNDVTAMGQSAGAISIGAHLHALGGQEVLFHKAILISGATPMVYLFWSQYDVIFREYSSSVGCTTNFLACLRGLSANELNKYSAMWPSFPIIDWYYVQRPMPPLAEGNFRKIPIFIISNKNEGSLFPFYYGLTTEGAVNDSIIHFVPTLSSEKKIELSRQYQVSNYAYPGAAFANFFENLLFYCPNSAVSESYTTYGQKVYVARNNHVPVINPYKDLPVPTGVYHAAEIPFIFNMKSLIHVSEREYAKKYRGTIGSFVKTGSPDSTWNAYVKNSNQMIDIETNAIITENRNDKCDLMKTFYFNQIPSDRYPLS
jgi:carboxylesterase type B